MRLSLALVTAALLAGPALAQDAAPKGTLTLELNALTPSETGCRITLLASNALGAELVRSAFEIALFGDGGGIERLVSLAEDGAVLKRLPFRLEGGSRPRSLPEALEAEEKRRVLDALQAHNWNKQRAANSLGTSRTTLIAKMNRMGITAKKP